MKAGTFRVKLPLAGAFQAENALVAAGLALAAGCQPEQVFAALENLHGAPGRLEFVGDKDGAPVFVDYAHKPDALEKALAALKPFAQNRLIVVFGCGGDRDQGKRPLMGEIAARGADVVIVTDDNPRSEEAARSAPPFWPPRRARWRSATALKPFAPASPCLKPGDVLLIAGKGHETGQIVGKRGLAFFRPRRGARSA